MAEFGNEAVDWVKPNTHASLRVHAGLCMWMCVLVFHCRSASSTSGTGRQSH